MPAGRPGRAPSPILTAFVPLKKKLGFWAGVPRPFKMERARRGGRRGEQLGVRSRPRTSAPPPPCGKPPVPPAFLPCAGQPGLMRRLTRGTLDHAIAQGALWRRAGKALVLAVNISVDDIGDVRLDSRVASLLPRHQLPPALLTLELTESGFIEDPTRALRVLDAIAALGVSLSIDDFGTGYSSLSHLVRLPVHEVKIDRSFVQGLESDPEFAPVVRAAIDMGHGLGLQVVAEGIETDEAAVRLRDFGCDIAQGYLYAKPMPLAAFETWLEGRVRVPVIAVPVDFKTEDLADTVSLGVY